MSVLPAAVFPIFYGKKVPGLFHGISQLKAVFGIVVKLMKLIVHTRPACADEIDQKILDTITNDYIFEYDESTTVGELIWSACSICKDFYDPDVHNKRFAVCVDDNLISPNEEAILQQFLNYLGLNDSITLIYSIGLSGGYGLDLIEGVQFFFHSNENGHTPHVHASYQDDEVSVDLLTSKVSGKLKSKKKMKLIMEYVKENRQILLDEYAKHTNGIYVDTSTWPGNF